MKATLVEPLMKFRPALIRQLQGTATDEDLKLLTQFPWSKEQVAWGEARSSNSYIYLSQNMLFVEPLLF